MEKPVEEKPAEEPPVAEKPAEEKPARVTPAQRAQEKRDQKLADIKDEIETGRMTVRKLTPEEMEEHAKRRAEVQADRSRRKR